MQVVSGVLSGRLHGLMASSVGLTTPARSGTLATSTSADTSQLSEFMQVSGRTSLASPCMHSCPGVWLTRTVVMHTMIYT